MTITVCMNDKRPFPPLRDNRLVLEELIKFRDRRIAVSGRVDVILNAHAYSAKNALRLTNAQTAVISRFVPKSFRFVTTRSALEDSFPPTVEIHLSQVLVVWPGKWLRFVGLIPIFHLSGSGGLFVSDLVLQLDDRSHRFDTPEDAREWVETLESTVFRVNADGAAKRVKKERDGRRYRWGPVSFGSIVLWVPSDVKENMFAACQRTRWLRKLKVCIGADLEADFRFSLDRMRASEVANGSQWFGEHRTNTRSSVSALPSIYD